MTDETFDFIWHQGIIKAADDIKSEISENVRSAFGFELDISDKTYRLLRQEYDRARKEIRSKYFNVGKNSENLIDGHKICACLTYALLKIHLFKYDMSRNDIPLEIMYSNYAVAFMGGIYVLYLFLLSDYIRENDMQSFDALRDQATFQFPETNPGHDQYVQGRIKTLALNDLYGKDFDYLTYADMLFWIEKYNKEIISKIVTGN